ncbi:MAG: MMPL family transporter [Firmicutes bacterium]|nr:MMPL family transporter [Bacillota bacterium]
MLAKLSVERKYTVFVAVVAVIILGMVSFINLQTDLLPKIDLPYLLVMTSYPGASPEEVEMVVTRPIEQVMATVNNIKNVRSISRENSSIVILEFNNDVNLDSATIEVNNNLDLIKSAWQDNVGSPVLMRLNPEMMPILVAAVDIEGKDIAEVSRITKEEIIPSLESVNGVASVSAVGLLEEKIEVVISEEKIEEINSKVLAGVDANLAQAERELLTAKKEIEKGKERLVEENAKQSEKIAEGEKAIAAAREQITAAEKQIEISELGLIQAKQALLNALDLLGNGASGQEILDFLKDKGIPLEQKDFGDLQGSLKTVLEEKLAELDAELSQIQEQKALLQVRQQELNTKEKELAEGKKLLAAEMEKAKTQLLSGEITLNTKLAEFEAAKEEAFKKASLQGMLTPEMIAGILAAQNFAMPAGYINEEGAEYLIKVGNKIKDIDELKGLVLFDTAIDGVGKIYLEDVAEIRLRDNGDENYAKIDGNDAVILLLQKQSNYSTAAVSDDIAAKIDELTEKNSELHLTTLMDQGMYIDIVIDSVLDNLIYGGILAVLILLVFLKDLKPTIVIALSIPISVIFALALMYFTGLTLNIISLAGLALGVGMLVDNSIVVIENIYRLRSEGLSPIQAAIEGTKEVTGAIAASTLTTVCVFLPIVFTKGLTRQIFADMGLTIAYSLTASLLVAITLVPTMASLTLHKTQTAEQRAYQKMLNFYEPILRWSLRYKGAVLLFVTVLFVLSCVLAFSLGTSFLPEMDAPQMSVSIEMPRETELADTIAMTEKVIERIEIIDDIETIGVFQNPVMGLGMRGGRDNAMSLYLVLKEDKELSNQEIAAVIREKTDDLPCDISVVTTNMDMSALGGSGIEVVIKGRELDTLQELAGEISKLLQETEGTDEVSSSLEDSAAEIRIAVNKEKAMENGLTVAQVYAKLNSLLSDKTATTLSDVDKDYPVIIAANRKMKREELADLVLQGTKNGAAMEVRLGDIAEISEGSSPAAITRDAQVRYLSVRASIAADANIGLVSREVAAKLDNLDLPNGYQVELAGETKLVSESLRDLIYMIALAIILIYLIMVAQFQSLLSPFIVMFTIPLAFTGGLLALALTGYDVSLIAMLGFLVLSGIVVNNGIVFVDYTNMLRERGLDTTDALITAGKTRLRPILMTALTTILGLSTMSLGVGMGAEALQPFAIVAIGGLLYATILTLLVIPVMYALFHKA